MATIATIDAHRIEADRATGWVLIAAPDQLVELAPCELIINLAPHDFVREHQALGARPSTNNDLEPVVGAIDPGSDVEHLLGDLIEAECFRHVA